MTKKTLVTYLGKEDPGSSCGYCKSKHGFKTWAMWAYQMTVQDYQDLIDRGFRRSGQYVYKPVMHETCCPMYTIRNRVNDFRMSSTHRRVLKQVAHFLNTGEKPRSRTSTATGAGGDQAKPSKRSAGGVGSKTAAKGGAKAPKPQVQPGGDGRNVKSKETKAKYKRWQRKLEHMKIVAERGGKSFDALLAAYHERRKKRLEKNKEKSLEDLLNLVRPDAKHKLTCKLVRSSPKSPAYLSTLNAVHAVYSKYQMRVHGDSPSKCDLRQFERFLAESPLKEISGALTSGYGSFHYQYWLDDRLIGVSVLDFLTHCLSSVYFFYDTDYEFLSLGTYSALREIAYTRELQEQDPAMQYYYLGYYIHTCPKMRYKGQYSGSDLLCPETYLWCPLEPCRALLDRKKYNRLCSDPKRVDESPGTPNMCQVLWNGAIMPMNLYKGVNRRANDDREVVEYSRLVGTACASRIILLMQ